MRYAIYFAPDPASPLHRFGSSWLLRDSITMKSFSPLQLDGLPRERVPEITASPRLYGFHATLKPPFVLAPNRTLDDLRSRLTRFAAQRAPFDAPRLKLAAVGKFLALVLSTPSIEMSCLADDCVRDFDDFRAPAPPDEVERRRQASLSPRQDEFLHRWGYPYVFDEWRFHMTLTRSLDRSELAVVEAALRGVVDPVCRTPLHVGAISVFEQPAHDVPFRQSERFALAGLGS